MDRKSITRFRKSLEARHRQLGLSVVQTQKEMLTAQHDYGKDDGDRANTSLAKELHLAQKSRDRALLGAVDGKRLTNTPVRQAGSVLKCPDDRKNRVVSAQATHPRRSSEVGGGIQEQRYAPKRVLPESRFELLHSGSPSEKAALEKKA
jgi:hypothetical protein